MSKLDALTNFAVFIKIYEKRRVSYEKMLAKAVALSLVMGGIGFVANDAQAAKITDGVKVFSGKKVEIPGIPGIRGCDVKTENELEKDTALANQNDLKAVNDDVEAAKTNIANNKDNIDKNAKDIAANKNAIDKERTDRVAMDDSLKKSIDKERTDRVAMDDSLKKSIDKERTDRVAMDDSLKKSIDKERTDRVAMDDSLKKSIDKERTDRVAMDDSLKKSIDKERTDRVAMDNAEKTARENADKALSDRIDTNKAAIEKETADRVAEDKRIEAKFDGEVSRLDSKIDKLDARVEKVGAMAAAIANLHTMGYDPEAPTEIAVGVGQYRDKTGLALGAFHYPNRDFMLSFSVSTAGDEYMGGIGATWKFGRKTPEELRQAEAEKAAKAKLAKAEAAKKAAKDARVAAQQKRHAEMLAARTAK